MSEYLNDEQQAEQLKKLIKQHGMTFLTVVMLIIAVYFGWQYWQTSQYNEQVSAANDFNQFQKYQTDITAQSMQNGIEDAEQVATDNDAELAKKNKALQLSLDRLLTQHPDSVYTWKALMRQAAYAVEAQDYAEATKRLEQAQQMNIEDQGLKALTQLQLGHVLLANDQLTEALEVTQRTVPAAFVASQQELLGDIYQAQNQIQEAKNAYQAAWDQLSQRHENRAVLKLKMEDLGLTPEAIDTPQLVNTPDTAASIS